MNGTCTFAKQISASAGLTSAGNITTSGTATITALSTGFLIGPYKNAATATASITTAGDITGTSLELGTGTLTTSNGIISGASRVSMRTGSNISIITTAPYNIDMYMIFNRGATAGNILMPDIALSTTGQKITLRSCSSSIIPVYYITPTLPTSFINLIGTTTYAAGLVGTFNLLAGTSRTFICDGTYWVEI